MHVFDPRFAPSPHWTRRPPDAPVAAYRALQRRLGTRRAVVVNPSTYGIDNECTLAALADMGPAVARGIAVVSTEVSEPELERLAAAGIVGVRVNFVSPQSWGITTLEMLKTLARRVQPLGWHVQVFMHGAQIVEARNVLQSLPVPVVIDHLGRVPQPGGTRDPAFDAIVRLLDSGRVWIKLSGAYMDSVVGGPSYADMAPLAREFVERAPERMVWGSDWPHTTATKAVDDADLLDILGEWAPNAEVRHRILVENPEVLYGFEPREAS